VVLSERILCEPNELDVMQFPEFWEIFWHGAWRFWSGNCPRRRVFAEVDPKEDLGIFQFLTDERYRVIERLLGNPDPDIRKGFTEPFRVLFGDLHGDNPDPEW
jgi:hypothetical protein